MEKVYLCFGSNIGDRFKNITEAAGLIGKLPKTKIVRCSGVYESSPIGPIQRSFLNAVVRISTAIEPMGLLSLVKKIEKKLRRRKTIRWGPRTMDVDILLYGKRILRHPDLMIPHTDIHTRKFALTPLVEIGPDEVHPVLKKTFKNILSDLTDDSQKVEFYKKISLGSHFRD